MTSAPISSTEGAVSPLHDFPFTSDWLAGKEFPRSVLAPASDLLSVRIDAIGSGGWTPWTASEVDELAEFNQAAGNSAGVKLSSRLSDPDALVVVTGQQPDLLASPLFVLHKALSAVAWARLLSEELSRTVTPVFWVASDDDDFGELKQAGLAAWNGELIDAGLRISRGEGIKQGAAAYDWNLSESHDRLQADIKRALHAWPDGEARAEWLIEQISAEPNFERCFCRLLAALLGDEFGMVFVAPRLPSMRRRGGEILAKDLKGHSTVNHSVMTATDRFLDAGYPVTLARDESALNFFWLHNNRRQRLIRGEDGTITAIDPITRKESGNFSESELQQMLHDSPGAFAPNVVTRPVVQDTALPTAMYVAGPGEMAYLALLNEAYAHYGVARSAVTPRAMITLEPVSENASTGEDGVVALSRESDQSRAVLEELKSLSRDVSDRFDSLRVAANGRGPATDLALDKTRKHFDRGLGQLRRRLARQVAPDAWNHIARKKTLTGPAGKPQERILAPWNFVKPGEWDELARYLYAHADFTATGPHSMAMPPWMMGAT